MKKGFLLSLTTLLAGVGGAVLRRLEWNTGFEPETGLAIAGNRPLLGLLLLSALLGIGLILALRTGKAPANGSGTVVRPRSFVCLAATGIAALALAVGGVLAAIDAQTQAPPQTARMIWGLCAVVTAGFLLWTAVGPFVEKTPGKYRFRLLVPAFFCCYWLILAYEAHSANPVILQYMFQLFAVICILLSFYFIAGFDFGRAKVRSAAFFGYWGCFFTGVTLMDPHTPGIFLIHAAAAVYLLFYLPGVLAGAAQSALPETAETEPSPADTEEHEPVAKAEETVAEKQGLVTEEREPDEAEPPLPQEGTPSQEV